MADRQCGPLAGVSQWPVQNPITSQTPKSESCEEHHTACSHLEPNLTAHPGRVFQVKLHTASRERRCPPAATSHSPADVFPYRTGSRSYDSAAGAGS